MECMGCGTPFSAEDAEMIRRDNDTALCDFCGIAESEIHVKYDGMDDLLDFLKKEVPTKGICTNCRTGKIELLRIEFGNPVIGYIRCENCETIDQVDIHLEMV